MNWSSSLKFVVLAVAMTSVAAFAQNGTGRPGLTGGGSIPTSGANVGKPPNGAGPTGTAGTQSSAIGGSNSGDRAVDAQYRAVDTKIKSICKGC